jgi:hypothetical protein
MRRKNTAKGILKRTKTGGQAKGVNPFGNTRVYLRYNNLKSKLREISRQLKEVQNEGSRRIVLQIQYRALKGQVKNVFCRLLDVVNSTAKAQIDHASTATQKKIVFAPTTKTHIGPSPTGPNGRSSVEFYKMLYGGFSNGTRKKWLVELGKKERVWSLSHLTDLIERLSGTKKNKVPIFNKGCRVMPAMVDQKHITYLTYWKNYLKQQTNVKGISASSGGGGGAAPPAA